MSSKKIGLSVIVPAFNEKEAIGRTLRGLKSALENKRYEIIVVDDGSVDKTASIAKSYKVKVISHERNLGYGAAIKTGIRAARYRLIAITDADGTYSQRDLVKLLGLMKEFDMAVGVRGGKNTRGSRGIGKWFLVRLAEYLSGQKIPDLNSGLRVFKKDLALRYFHLLPSGFSFTSTISLAFLSEGYLVKYWPISYKKRLGRSKIKPIKDMINFLVLILRTIMFFKPLKILLIVSLFFFILAIFVFFSSLLLTGKVADISVIVLIIAAIQTGILALLADLIIKRGISKDF
jgi:glycosyltransferase involved in cell wall biosynthesis